MVRAGMGSAVLPWLVVHGSDVQADDRLRVHELRPALPPREVFLLWRAGRSHSPLAARTIEFAVEAAAALVEQM
jgi:DNA-binding transcriptional LysR family regulator